MGPEHPRLAEYLTEYAALLRKNGRKQEARTVESRARQLLLAHPELGQTVDLRELTHGR